MNMYIYIYIYIYIYLWVFTLVESHFSELVLVYGRFQGNFFIMNHLCYV